MTEAPLLVSTDDQGITTFTVNRPQALNALNSDVLSSLAQAIAQLDGNTKLVIVEGAGGKAFVAGADIAEMADYGPAEAEAFSKRGQAAFQALAELPFPVIAKVPGFALGGGLELALACDVIFAGPKAKVGLPESTLAVVPGFGGTQRLARRVGAAQAKRLLFSGEMVGAEEALRMGIVDVVAEDLEEAVANYAKSCLRNGPLALASAKVLVDEGMEVTEFQGIEMEAEAFGAIFGTADQKEGMRAFLEKRKASFQGQ